MNKTVESKSEMTKQIPGGWSKYNCIDQEKLKIFNDVQLPLGVDYEPFAVSTQVVDGRNIKYLCNTRVVYPEAPYYLTIVDIFEPKEGTPYLTEIRRIDQ